MNRTSVRLFVSVFVATVGVDCADVSAYDVVVVAIFGPITSVPASPQFVYDQSHNSVTISSRCDLDMVILALVW